MKNYFLFFVLSLFLSACCSGPITTYNKKIEHVEFIADSIVPKHQVFQFEMKDSTSVVSTSRNNGSRCDDEEMFRDDPIHFISNVDVHALTDFSSDYPANSLLNDLITVEFYNNFNNKRETRPLDQWTYYLRRRAKLWEFHEGKFTIRQQPTSQPNQTFSLIFTLSDDTTLETVTHEIVWE